MPKALKKRCFCTAGTTNVHFPVRKTHPTSKMEMVLAALELTTTHGNSYIADFGSCGFDGVNKIFGAILVSRS